MRDAHPIRQKNTAIETLAALFNHKYLLHWPGDRLFVPYFMSNSTENLITKELKLREREKKKSETNNKFNKKTKEVTVKVECERNETTILFTFSFLYFTI